MDGPASPSRSRPQPGRTATHVDTRHGGDLVRLAAFTTVPDGGNPAGVWIGDRFPDDGQMQAIAAEVGYSETVFATPRSGDARTVRYFSPMAEVPLCGHATIALGVALGTAPLVPAALELLGWRDDELDDQLPPAVAYAGAHHLVLAVADRATLSRLDYDFDGLRRLMLDHDLVTLQLVWRHDDDTFHAPNPFPVGGVVEDPATVAAAAALGRLPARDGSGRRAGGDHDPPRCRHGPAEHAACDDPGARRDRGRRPRDPTRRVGPRPAGRSTRRLRADGPCGGCRSLRTV
jgi:predicted PhzF superfamily epimerase YddE/YHI9